MQLRMERPLLLLYVAVVLLMEAAQGSSSSSSGSCRPSLLPSLDALQQEALLVGSTVSRNVQQRLIPGIRFTCPGNLTRWTAVVSQVGGGTNYPRMQIWRTVDGNTYERVASSRIQFATGEPYIWEKETSNPIPFQAGDVLGVFTPPVPKLSLKFQERGGPTNYYIGGPAEQYSTFRLDGGLVLSAQNDYPLVAAEVSNPECLEGFLDLPTLLVKAFLLSGAITADVTYTEATQRLFPELSLPCSGAILGWTLAALNAGGSKSKYPELQVWRNSGGSSYYKVSGIAATAGIAATGELNVFRYEPPEPMQFESGDVLGWYQPYDSSSVLRAYLQRDGGPVSYRKTAQGSASELFDLQGGLVGTDNHLPLICLEISASGTTSTIHFPTSTITTHTPTPTPTPTPTSAHLPIITMTTPTPTPTTSAHLPIVTMTTSVPEATLAPSNTIAIVSVSVVVTLCVVGACVGVGVGLGVWAWWRVTHHLVTVGRNRRLEARNRALCELEYNNMYIPRDNREVIINGQKHSVNMGRNLAYSIESGPPKPLNTASSARPLPAEPHPPEPHPSKPSNSSLEHTYESL